MHVLSVSFVLAEKIYVMHLQNKLIKWYQLEWELKLCKRMAFISKACVNVSSGSLTCVRDCTPHETQFFIKYYIIFEASCQVIIILHLAISLFFPLKINCFHAVNRPGKQISNASFVFWVSQLKITHSGHFHSSRFFG